MRSRWFGGRSGPRLPAALVSVLVLVVVVPFGAASAEVSGPGPAVPAADGPSQTVTLVTGDVLRVQGEGAAATASVVRPAASGFRAGTDMLGDDVRIFHTGEELFAIPVAAEPLLTAGQLDPRLFNLSLLVRDGYTDEKMARLPVIVTYHEASAQAAPTPIDGAELSQSLPSASAAAMAVDKHSGRKFWDALTHPPSGAEHGPSAMASGVKRLWLDGKVATSDEVSRVAVGADKAWAAGFDGAGVTVAELDTGVDTNHPDLAGQVVESRSFVPDSDPADRYGHGTHVASIIAGTGAASAGKYAGVGPKAKLYNGKVLGDNGSGYESWIIAGMEWGASKAKVVSMSLGGAATSGFDPMSQALNDISRRTGALFVVAAGNAGSARSVGAPGAAEEAFTVGATERNGSAMTTFSSIEPRVGDWALKPNISAPGRGIWAASANNDNNAICKSRQGLCNGTGYLPLSGTSMATPHVAAMAAIVLQRHPDWTRQQIRDALSSTASPVANGAAMAPIWQQGTGLANVGRAVVETVHGTGSVDLGEAGYPQKPGDTVSGTVTYNNSGASPVTLDVTNPVWQRYNPDWPKGSQVVEAWTPPAGAVRVQPTHVTVPAGGSAAVTITVVADQMPVGKVFGMMTATQQGGSRLTATLGATRSKESYALKVTGVEVDGSAPDPSGSRALVRGLRTGAMYYGTFDTAGAVHWLSLTDNTAGSTRLVPDTYRLVGMLTSSKLHHVVPFGGWSVALDQDRQVTLDVRQAKEIQVRTERPTVQDRTDFGMRDDAGGGFGFRVGWRTAPGDEQFQLVGPQPDGMRLQMVTRRVAAPLTLRGESDGRGNRSAGGDGKVQAQAVPTRKAVGLRDPSQECPYCPQPLPKGGDLTLVDAGDGSDQALAGKDLSGAVALIREAPGAGAATRVVDAEVNRAVKAGAVGVVFAVDAGAPVRYSAWDQPIWVMVTTAAHGASLARLAGDGPARLEVDVNLPSPYVYSLNLLTPMTVDGVYQVDQSQLATATTHFHAPYPGAWAFKWDERDYFGPSYSQWYLFSSLPLPHVETEYLSPRARGRTELCHIDAKAPTPFNCSWASALVTPLTQPGQKIDRHFMAGPYVPSHVAGGWPLALIHHDYPGSPMMWWPMFESAYTERDAFLGSGDGYGGLLEDTWSPYDLYKSTRLVNTHTKITRGDQTVCDVQGVLPSWPCSVKTSGQHTVVVTTSQDTLPTSTRTTTRWELNVDLKADTVPLVLADYQLPVDLNNAGPGGTHEVSLRVAYQPDSLHPGGLVPPASWNVKAWATFDDGKTWRPVYDAQIGSDGRFRPEINPPTGHNGFVGLRLQAEDGKGNALDQTIIRAYRLSGGGDE